METKDVLIGIGLGLLIVWIYNKRNNTQLSSSEYQYVLGNMINRMDRLEELMIRHQEYQQQEYQQRPIQQLYQPIEQPIPKLSQTPMGYKNNEKWVITRDKTGHIDSLEIVRDAKVTE